MPRQTIQFILFVLFGLITTTTTGFAQDWRTLAPGIQYQDLNASLLTPWSHIHVFRIDLKQNQLDLMLAKSLSKPNASIDEFAQESQALIALNGGFFDQNYHPLGLRISHHQQKNSLKRISWWGVFYTQNQKPYLTSMRNFRKNNRIEFALQSGPRLIVDNKIPSLKPGIAERTALGITPDDEVIILVTENTPMTTESLAHLMKSSPLDCKQALNLDGGSSSQLKATIDSFKINVHGFSNVSDAIVVLPRKQTS